MADKPVHEVVGVDAALDALVSPTSSDVYEAVDPFSDQAVAAVAAKRALEGGGGGSQTVYVSADDPGAVGFGMVWIDTSLNDSDVPVIKVRNAADDDWDSAWSLGAPLATEGWDIRGDPTNSNAARLALSHVLDGSANLFGADAPDSTTGGASSINGGTGSAFASNGAAFYAQGGSADGVTHGRAQITTDNSAGSLGQMLVSNGANYAVWGNTFVPPTSDPHIAGAIWNNAGTLAISAG